MNITISSLIYSTIFAPSPFFVNKYYSFNECHLQKFSQILFYNQRILHLRKSIFSNGLNSIVYNNNVLETDEDNKHKNLFKENRSGEEGHFEQVNVDSESKMLSKFYRVYCSCISTTRDFEFKKELIFCSKYEHVAESNECILSCSSNIKEQNIAQIENIIKLYDCVNIYIKSDKHLSQSIIKIISFNKKVKFNIIMDCCENSILLDRMIMIHSNVSVTNYIEDNENKYDICLCGTLDAGITIKNWDRVFVID